MSAVRLVHESEPVYKFKEGAQAPHGVTPSGVMSERARIAGQYGAATVKLSAQEVLSAPQRYPNLRSFGPATPEEAMQRAMEEGVRYAYRSVVEVVTQKAERGKTQTIELRVFHAVPKAGVEGLSYEPIEVIWDTPEQKTFLIRELRLDARAFAEKLERTLAEIEYWDR